MTDEQTDNVIFYGSAIKDLGDGRIGGYLVLFGDEKNTDLERDYFTKDTDFGDAIKTPIWFNHRQPLANGSGKSIVVREAIGQGELKQDDEGIFVEAVLYNRNQYAAMLDKLGWSSGTAEHLVDRQQVGKSYHITRWPLGLDASLTPIPAEPRTQAIPLKSLKAELSDVADVTSPEDDGKSSGDNDHNVNINVTVRQQETKTMDENIKNGTEPAQVKMVEEKPAEPVAVQPEQNNYATKDEFKTLSDAVTSLVNRLENSKPLKDAGYIAPDDEATRPEVKSFGDFVVAVARGNHKRLVQVYKATKDLSGETGTAGGYLVPEQFEAQLLQIAENTSQILPLVTTVPVSSDTGRYPSLDQYITPTAGSGQTAMAAGVVATPTAPGGTLTETEPGFEMLQWRVNKVGGYTEVENELIADSPQAIEVLLTRLFGVAVMARKEQLILRGTGAGEPEGILNAAAAVGLTPATNNTFAWADALSMISRFKPVGGRPIWVIHPGIWPDIGVFESSSGGGVFQANMQAALGNSLLGYPILQSEHLPQDDNAGCVVLMDPSAYLLFERSGISIAFSEHAAFTTEKGTWRFSQRFDGMSWVKSAITLADPQGSYTISPFVYLND